MYFPSSKFACNLTQYKCIVLLYIGESTRCHYFVFIFHLTLFTHSLIEDKNQKNNFFFWGGGGVGWGGEWFYQELRFCKISVEL